MAIKRALNRKGYWRLSQTLATRNAMPNMWLEQQRLISLKQHWSDLTPMRVKLPDSFGVPY